MNCKECGADYTQRGGDPTLADDECKECELVRLREEIADLHKAKAIWKDGHLEQMNRAKKAEKNFAAARGRILEMESAWKVLSDARAKCPSINHVCKHDPILPEHCTDCHTAWVKERPTPRS